MVFVCRVECVGCVKRTKGIRWCVSRTLQVALCAGWIVVAAAVLVGCGRSGPERVIVSGTVSFNGKPVSKGFIRFSPLPGQQIPVTIAPITEGKYRVDLRGGVPVGSHYLMIEAYRKLPPAARKIMMMGPTRPPEATLDDHRQQWLPAKYNTNSDLTITIESGSQEITKNFELTE